MVSTTGMVVSLKTDLRFPESGQQGHGARIIHQSGWKFANPQKQDYFQYLLNVVLNFYMTKKVNKKVTLSLIIGSSLILQKNIRILC